MWLQIFLELYLFIPLRKLIVRRVFLADRKQIKGKNGKTEKKIVLISAVRQCLKAL